MALHNFERFVLYLCPWISRPVLFLWKTKVNRKEQIFFVHRFLNSKVIQLANQVFNNYKCFCRLIRISINWNYAYGPFKYYKYRRRCFIFTWNISKTFEYSNQVPIYFGKSKLSIPNKISYSNCCSSEFSEF